MISDKDQKLYKELENRLYNGTQIRVGQTSLNFAQLIYFKNKLSEMTPKYAFQAYNMIRHFCIDYGLELPISLLELKNLKDYRVEQMINDIQKDFE